MWWTPAYARLRARRRYGSAEDGTGRPSGCRPRPLACANVKPEKGDPSGMADDIIQDPDPNMGDDPRTNDPARTAAEVGADPAAGDASTGAPIVEEPAPAPAVPENRDRGPKVRVRVLVEQPGHDGRGYLASGSEVDLSKDQAQGLLSRGEAEPVAQRLAENAEKRPAAKRKEKR